MRDYKDEYKKFQSSPEQRANNRKRKRDRYKLEKQGRVSKGDGKEVHHTDGINSNKLTVSSKSENRGKKNEGGRRKGVGHNYPKKRKYVKGGRPGLWANIHAKRKRIAAGSGEKMRKPGSKGAPTSKALKESKAEEGAVVYNKPKRTPSHPTKSHMVVVRKPGGGKKTIRFGEQGASTAGKPKSGESNRMKMKRKSFKARHRKNIAKGKMSAAYWADKVKW